MRAFEAIYIGTVGVNLKVGDVIPYSNFPLAEVKEIRSVEYHENMKTVKYTCLIKYFPSKDSNPLLFRTKE